MRLLIIGLLAAVAAGACNRAEAPAAGNALVAPATSTSSPGAAAPNRDAGVAPIATAGRTEPVREAAVREVTIPAGTQLPLVLETPVASDTSRVEEPVHAHLARAIVVHGVTALPEGSRVSGVVTDATQSGKVKGRAHVAVRFHTLVPRGDDERYSIQTGPVGRTAPGTKKRDALEIGLPAAGGLIGGKKGAVIGGAAGGGAGTAVVLNQRGKEVRLGKGAALTLRLTQPLTIRVRG
jgi:hypothetical protein